MYIYMINKDIFSRDDCFRRTRAPHVCGRWLEKGRIGPEEGYRYDYYCHYY